MFLSYFSNFFLKGKTMYEIFEKLLNENGVSAYKVSKYTGITTATLTSWKQGKYVPKQDKLQKIAEYFGVTVDYLMGIEVREEKPKEPVYSELKKLIARNGKEMSDAQKMELIKLLSQLN